MNGRKKIESLYKMGEDIQRYFDEQKFLNIMHESFLEIVAGICERGNVFYLR